LKIAYLRQFLVKSLMDNNRKLLYDPPVIKIVDVKTEGLARFRASSGFLNYYVVMAAKLQNRFAN